MVSSILNMSNPLTNGLICSYPLNEGGGQRAFNSANSRSSAPLSGGAVFSRTTVDGEVDFNGIQFTGSKIVIPNPWSDTPTSYTVSCWFKSSNILIGKFLFNWRNPGTSAIWFQVNSTNTSRIDFTVGDNGGIANCLSGTLSSGVWYHFVGVRNGNNIYNYINGVYQSTASRAFGNRTGITDCVIGAQSGDYNADWLGKINKVNVWKRALNATEIMSLYTNPNQIYKTNNNIIYQQIANLKSKFWFFFD
jgi:hypothetical protein